MNSPKQLRLGVDWHPARRGRRLRVSPEGNGDVTVLQLDRAVPFRTFLHPSGAEILGH